MNSPIRVALINDHPLVLHGLRALLREYEQVDVVELDILVKVEQRIDVALLDTYAQSTPVGREVSARVAEGNIAHVAVYTWAPEQQLVEKALASGATGVLAKSLDGEQLVAAIVRIAGGEVVVEYGGSSTPDLEATNPGRKRDWPGRSLGLSMREAEMISLICQGISNEQIAERLFLSPNSVKSYIRSAYHKAGVQTRAQAVIWGIENGLRPTPSREAV